MINLLVGEGGTVIKKSYLQFECVDCGVTFESDEYIVIKDPELNDEIVGVGESCPICYSFCVSMYDES